MLGADSKFDVFSCKCETPSKKVAASLDAYIDMGLFLLFLSRKAGKVCKYVRDKVIACDTREYSQGGVRGGGDVCECAHVPIVCLLLGSPPTALIRTEAHAYFHAMLAWPSPLCPSTQYHAYLCIYCVPLPVCIPTLYSTACVPTYTNACLCAYPIPMPACVPSVYNYQLVCLLHTIACLCVYCISTPACVPAYTDAC